MRLEDFQVQVRNNLEYGQLIIVRKVITQKEMDVSRSSTDNLHLVVVELLEQPICNVINVYA